MKRMARSIRFRGTRLAASPTITLHQGWSQFATTLGSATQTEGFSRRISSPASWLLKLLFVFTAETVRRKENLRDLDKDSTADENRCFPSETDKGSGNPHRAFLGPLSVGPFLPKTCSPFFQALGVA